MASLNNESRINGGLDPLYVGKVSSTGVYYPSVEELQTTWTTNTRWDDLVFRDTPVSNNTTATISSSNDRTVFNLSANFYTDNGMYIKDDYTKGGYNLSVDHNIYDNFKVRFPISFPAVCAMPMVACRTGETLFIRFMTKTGTII